MVELAMNAITLLSPAFKFLSASAPLREKKT